MEHHPSCRPDDTVLMRVCEQCGSRESAHDVEAEISRLKDEMEKAKKCSFCGSNDLVCGAGWKEQQSKLILERNQLQAQLDAAKLIIQNLVDSHFSNKEVDRRNDISDAQAFLGPNPAGGKEREEEPLGEDCDCGHCSAPASPDLGTRS